MFYWWRVEVKKISSRAVIEEAVHHSGHARCGQSTGRRNEPAAEKQTHCVCSNLDSAAIHLCLWILVQLGLCAILLLINTRRSKRLSLLCWILVVIATDHFSVQFLRWTKPISWTFYNVKGILCTVPLELYWRAVFSILLLFIPLTCL